MTFLAGDDVGSAIRKVVSGRRLRCAVAFWGEEGDEAVLLENLPGGARIICNVEMGGTNPAVLRRLGAPDSPNLRYLPRLHAKVYLSDVGLVVGSANASSNGLGGGPRESLREACVLFKPGSETFVQASKWFDRIWKVSIQVDEDTLALCHRAFTRRPKVSVGQGGAFNPASLLDHLMYSDRDFRGIGFVIAEGSAHRRDRDEAAEGIIQDDGQLPVPRLTSKEDKRRIREWPIGNVFSNWTASDIDAWPGVVILAHKGPRTRRFMYYYYKREYTTVLDGDSDEPRGMVFATRLKKRDMGFESTERTMAEIDQGRLEAMLAAVDGARMFENMDLFRDFYWELVAANPPLGT